MLMIERSSGNASLQERAAQLQADLAIFMQEIKLRKDENDKVIAWIAAANAVRYQICI